MNTKKTLQRKPKKRLLIDYFNKHKMLTSAIFLHFFVIKYRSSNRIRKNGYFVCET